MKRALYLSPVLLLVVGCFDLSTLIPEDDQASSVDVTDAEVESEEGADGEDASAQPETDPDTDSSTGCCSFQAEGPAVRLQELRRPDAVRYLAQVCSHECV